MSTTVDVEPGGERAGGTGPSAASPDRARPRRHRWRDWRTWLVLGALAVLVLLPLRGLLRNQGPPMEEGFMLVFPERVLKGDLPNRDFLHLYGPGSLWALAATYKVFGVSLLVERLFGLVQQMMIVGGRLPDRPAVGPGRRVRRARRSRRSSSCRRSASRHSPGSARSGSGCSASPPASPPPANPTTRRRHRLLVLAGVLAGCALLFRLDFIVALGLSGSVVGAGLAKRERRTLLLELRRDLCAVRHPPRDRRPGQRHSRDGARPRRLPARWPTALDPAAAGPPRGLAAEGRRTAQDRLAVARNEVTDAAHGVVLRAAVRGGRDRRHRVAAGAGRPKVGRAAVRSSRPGCSASACSRRRSSAPTRRTSRGSVASRSRCCRSSSSNGTFLPLCGAFGAGAARPFPRCSASGLAAARLGLPSEDRGRVRAGARADRVRDPALHAPAVHRLHDADVRPPP